MIQQYLTFIIEDTQYAINVFQIQEVLEYEQPQVIPCSSPLLLGIIRSRDTNIAIMDIRQKFSLPSKIPGTDTRTIVLEVVDQNHGVINLYGIIADSVLEVIELDDSKLEPLPKAKNFSGAEFVSSVFTNNGIYTLVLDVNKIFSEKEMSAKPSKKSEPKKTADTEVPEKKKPRTTRRSK